MDKTQFQRPLGSQFPREDPAAKNEKYRPDGQGATKGNPIGIDKLNGSYQGSREKGGNNCPG